jgi:phosphate butyryltransferase
MPLSNLDELVAQAEALPPSRMAVAAAHDPEVLRAVDAAQKRGIATADLIGDAQKIEQIAREQDLDLRGVIIDDQLDDDLAAAQAMTLVRERRANILVKGQIDSAAFLSAVLDRQHRICVKQVLSHVGMFEIGELSRPLFISDTGVVLQPTTKQKLVIIQNAVDVARRLGIQVPKVAILAANERVHPARPVGVEALLLTRMAREGWIDGAVVDGPMPLDIAVDPDVARLRHVDSPVAGQADILIVPNVEAGNIAAKAILYVGHGQMAGIVVGACAPIVLNSRADDATTRLRSVAMAALVADRRT